MAFSELCFLLQAMGQFAGTAQDSATQLPPTAQMVCHPYYCGLLSTFSAGVFAMRRQGFRLDHLQVRKIARSSLFSRTHVWAF